MTAVEIEEAVKRNEGKVAVTSQAVQAVGGTNYQTLSSQEIQEALVKVRGTSGTRGIEDGTRVHIHYKAFGAPTIQAIQCAARATELGLPRDRYTGRVHRVWKSKEGDQCISLWVELERDHMYRTLNLVKGEVLKFVVLGD